MAWKALGYCQCFLFGSGLCVFYMGITTNKTNNYIVHAA